MSMISITFDTKNKSLNVTMDGKKVSDVSSIYISNYKNYDGEDESHIEITKVKQDEENGLVERICVYANRVEHYKEPIVNTEKLSENIGRAMRIKYENI